MGSHFRKSRSIPSEPRRRHRIRARAVGSISFAGRPRGDQRAWRRRPPSNLAPRPAIRSASSSVVTGTILRINGDRRAWRPGRNWTATLYVGGNVAFLAALRNGRRQSGRRRRSVARSLWRSIATVHRPTSRRACGVAFCLSVVAAVVAASRQADAKAGGPRRRRLWHSR